MDPVPMLFSVVTTGVWKMRKTGKRGLLSWLFGAGWGTAGTGG